MNQLTGPSKRRTARERARLRARLKEGYIKRAQRDKEIVAEWDHLSAEVWAHLDCDEEQ